MSTRAGDILRAAAAAVDGPRNSAHGDKERSFEGIAEFWSVYLQHRQNCPFEHIEARDVACMMTLLKIARSLYGEPITDHFLDMAGYAAIAGELAEKGRVDDAFDYSPVVTKPTQEEVRNALQSLQMPLL